MFLNSSTQKTFFEKKMPLNSIHKRYRLL